MTMQEKYLHRIAIRKLKEKFGAARIAKTYDRKTGVITYSVGYEAGDGPFGLIFHVMGQGVNLTSAMADAGIEI